MSFLRYIKLRILARGYASKYHWTFLMGLGAGCTGYTAYRYIYTDSNAPKTDRQIQNYYHVVPPNSKLFSLHRPQKVEAEHNRVMSELRKIPYTKE